MSHRRAALRRADQIIVLVDGHIEAVGKLDDLLETARRFAACGMLRMRMPVRADENGRFDRHHIIEYTAQTGNGFQGT